jgi:uncharacterized Tic20 family protein
MNYDDLKTLDELRRSGAISEEEYRKEKEKIFSRPENSYIALMHVSQFAGLILPGLGFVAPILLWMINKNENATIDAVGRHIINFMISMFIYYAISGVLCCLVIGIPMLIALGIMQIVFIIIATIKANKGEPWRYPLTIDFLK